MLAISEILTAAKGRLTAGKTDIVFRGVTTDSREISRGDLFIALKGDNFDGHDYCLMALEKGAAAVLVQRDVASLPPDAVVIRVEDTLAAYQQIARYYRRSLGKLKVVAVTGSNGKTTTKDLIAALLAATYKVTKTEANYNNEVGLPKTLLALTAETEVAVVEMGMRGLGQIRALRKIAEPDFAVITNVGATHMELLGSMENIARAKGELLEDLDESKVAFLNSDDEYVRKMPTKAVKLTYGMKEDADIRAFSIVTSGQGTTFMYRSKLTGAEQEIKMPLIGHHNVMNALGAIGVAEKMGVTPKKIAEALLGVKITAKRQEISEQGDITVINDAYNASPASMEAALRTLAEVKKAKESGRSIAVLADMLELGRQAETAHREIGAFAARQGTDLVLAYGDQCRFLVEAALEAGVDAIHCGGIEEAAEELKKHLGSKDTVLFKGSHSMCADKVMELVFHNK